MTRPQVSGFCRLESSLRERQRPGSPVFQCRENVTRKPLINEVEIDVAGKSIQEVLKEAISIIESTPSLLDYEYTKPPKERFYSWVFANGLR